MQQQPSVQPYKFGASNCVTPNVGVFSFGGGATEVMLAFLLLSINFFFNLKLIIKI